MKKLLQLFKRDHKKKEEPTQERAELEKKAVEGAKKAVKDYRRVFERLAEYDRT